MIEFPAQVRWNALGPAGRVRPSKLTDPRGSHCLMCASPLSPCWGSYTRLCSHLMAVPWGGGRPFLD